MHENTCYLGFALKSDNKNECHYTHLYLTDSIIPIKLLKTVCLKIFLSILEGGEEEEELDLPKLWTSQFKYKY